MSYAIQIGLVRSDTFASKVSPLLPNSRPRWRGPAVTRGTHKDADALPFLPPVNRVVRDVAEQEIAAALSPDGPFGPRESIGERLDVCVARHEQVEVESLTAMAARAT